MAMGRNDLSRLLIRLTGTIPQSPEFNTLKIQCLNVIQQSFLVLNDPTTIEYNKLTKERLGDIEGLINFSIPTPEALRLINLRYENNLEELIKYNLTELHFLFLKIE